jgi:hypothetical protein
MNLRDMTLEHTSPADARAGKAMRETQREMDCEGDDRCGIR